MNEQRDYNYYPFFKNWITAFQSLTELNDKDELMNLIFTYWEEDRIPQLDEIKSEKVKKLWARDFIKKIKTKAQRKEINRRYHQKQKELKEQPKEEQQVVNIINNQKKESYTEKQSNNNITINRPVNTELNEKVDYLALNKAISKDTWKSLIKYINGKYKYQQDKQNNLQTIKIIIREELTKVYKFNSKLEENKYVVYVADRLINEDIEPFITYRELNKTMTDEQISIELDKIQKIVKEREQIYNKKVS